MKTHRLTLPALLLFLASQSLHAGSATWNLNPTSGDWNTAANWMPATVPSGIDDVATFGLSNLTDISTSAGVNISGVIFNAGASSFTITSLPTKTIEISGMGITNNSGITQNFVGAVDTLGNPGGGVLFEIDARAGDLTVFTANPSATSGGMVAGTGFLDRSSAGTAMFINLGGAVSGASGGVADFFTSATAEAGTFVNEGATVSDADGGATLFYVQSHAANATLMANPGSNGGGGGLIQFFDSSTGDTARVEVFGNGTLDVSPHKSMSIGSIEGDGLVLTGAHRLTVGTNGLSTTFSGVIKEGTGSGGSLAKTGAGTLTLSGANLYTAGTIVSEGTLVVSNTAGSGTGTGRVQVNAGTLGGSGIISGAVTVGTGGGTGAVLAPAAGANKQATLTIQSGLIFNSDSTYTYTFKAKGNKAKTDKVVANGVTINGATFAFQGTAQGTLKAGLTLTVISNTSATPIFGTFSNLPDGAILTVNGNNFQASYKGGDGNDLTLTVVP